jgi:alpha-1,6-mannosyltransferase
MSKHYYFTNSLPKLLAGTAVPLGAGGLIWLATLVGVVGTKSQSGRVEEASRKWLNMTGRNVGEVVWSFGPGVLGLVCGMSVIGHKVSEISPN